MSASHAICTPVRVSQDLLSVFHGLCRFSGRIWAPVMTPKDVDLLFFSVQAFCLLTGSFVRVSWTAQAWFDRNFALASLSGEGPLG